MALFGGKDAKPGALGVTLEQATAVVEAARKKAEEICVAMNIAIVDPGNRLVAIARMDGAWIATSARLLFSLAASRSSATGRSSAQSASVAGRLNRIRNARKRASRLFDVINLDSVPPKICSHR